MVQKYKICELCTKLLYYVPHCCEYLSVIKVIDSSSSIEIIEHKIEHTQEGILKKGMWLGRLNTGDWQAEKKPGNFIHC